MYIAQQLASPRKHSTIYKQMEVGFIRVEAIQQHVGVWDFKGCAVSRRSKLDA